MSFQAYLDTIKKKTGKTPDDFKKIAAKKGLLKDNVKAAEIVAWLKADFALGHGHAMAIFTVFKGLKEKKEPIGKIIAKHFMGKKSVWRSVFDSLVSGLREFEDDLTVSPASTYLSILRGERKVAVIQIAVAHVDIGIKLKGVAPTERFEAAGSWNAMMTHRVRIRDQKQVDKELMNWLRSAYEQNGPKK